MSKKATFRSGSWTSRKRIQCPFCSAFFFTLNAITSFSLKPLRLFTFLGFAIIAITVAATLMASVLYVVGQPPADTIPLIILGLLGIGLNSLGIGVLGEYVGRTYSEVKHRPCT